MDRLSAPERSSLIYLGDERSQLDSWLTFYRETLLMKCDGLDIEQMKQRPIPSSKLSLLGLVRHMTFVEQTWFERIFAGIERPRYYKDEPASDGDFDDLNSAGLGEVLSNYGHVIEVSTACAQGHGLDEVSATPWRGREVDLRWIYLHMFEEYARHCGHADLVRELVDGATGY
ncbi:MAG: DinB family protein [Acidimicrobiales bacterium]